MCLGIHAILRQAEGIVRLAARDCMPSWEDRSSQDSKEQTGPGEHGATQKRELRIAFCWPGEPKSSDGAQNIIFPEETDP